MLVPTEPFTIIATAVLLWLFVIACVLRDRLSDVRGGPRQDPMPAPARVRFCGLCGGPHDYDDCPLDVDAA